MTNTALASLVRRALYRIRQSRAETRCEYCPAHHGYCPVCGATHRKENA